MGRVPEAIVDRGLRHELLDLDGVAAFDGDVGQLVVFDLDVGVLADGVAFDLLLGGHLLTR